LTYSHPSFQRGYRHLCQYIRRKYIVPGECIMITFKGQKQQTRPLNDLSRAKRPRSTRTPPPPQAATTKAEVPQVGDLNSNENIFLEEYNRQILLEHEHFEDFLGLPPGEILTHDNARHGGKHSSSHHDEPLPFSFRQQTFSKFPLPKLEVGPTCLSSPCPFSRWTPCEDIRAPHEDQSSEWNDQDPKRRRGMFMGQVVVMARAHQQDSRLHDLPELSWELGEALNNDLFHRSSSCLVLDPTPVACGEDRCLDAPFGDSISRNKSGGRDIVEEIITTFRYLDE